MKITNIQPQKNDSDRFSLYIDGEFALGIDVDILLKYRLAQGDELSELDFNAIKAEDVYSKAKDAAIKYISKGMKSRFELVRSLITKGYEKDMAENIADYLKEFSYIDDVEYSKQFIADKLNINNFGKKRIVAELISKGISKNDIKLAFELYDDHYEYSESKACEEAIKSKIKTMNSNWHSDIKQRQRLLNYMLRRGFSYELINKIIKQHIQEEA